MKIKKLISLSLLFIAAMLWGFAFAAQGKVTRVGAFALGAARSFLACIFLVAVILVFDKKKGDRRLFSKKGIDISRYEIVGGVICGVILAVASAFQQIGINSGTDSGKAAFITALYVVLVPIYALPLGKRAPISVWLGVAVSVVGFYLLCIKENFSILPEDLLVIGCALIFPIHILTIDRFSPMVDGIRMSLVQFLTAGTVNLVISLITENPAEQISLILECLFSVVYLGIASSGIAYTLQIIGQRNVNPAAASIILSLESVFGVIGAALFLGTTLSIREYVGSAIILTAVIISQLEFGKKNKNSAKTPKNHRSNP